MSNILKGIVNCIPAEMIGYIEYYLRPEVRRRCAEAFNGQSFRKQIFEELIETISFQALVETGTFRGATTEYLAKFMKVPIWTVESNPRFFAYSQQRLRSYKHVSLHMGDSALFLAKLACANNVPKSHVFFYLDAHWHEHLPLREEVKIIKEHWSKYVIMIDDFEVPGDPGYRFDDYGSSGRLSLDYLGSLIRDMAVYFPAVNSTHETGKRRGSVVLIDEPLANRLSPLKTLKISETC